MSQSSSAFDPDEPILARFLQDLAAAGDPAVVLAAYVSAHPHLEKELRQLAAADDLMRRSRPEAEAAPPAPPSRLGEFRIVRRIAGGGMGEIYEAVQESLGRRVAVKTVRRGRLSPSAEARFLREQEVLASLHQTHIVPIHTAGRDGALQFFAMPFIEGVALHHVIRSLREDGPPPPSGKTPTLAVLVERASSAGNTPASGRREPADVVASAGSRRPLALPAAYFRSVAAVLGDAADALHYAHCHKAQILHRDVKPSNIMVDRAGQCWIIDFGLAAYLASGGRQPPDSAPTEAPDPLEAVTASGLLGTPQYMAPEQWRKEALDARTDVWGLGATLYELLALRRAFDGETVKAIQEQVLSRDPKPPRKYVRGVPGDLSAICRKALQKHADRRYATARDFAEDLRRWLRRESTSARPGLVRRVALWSLRNKGWAAAIALTLTAALGFVSAWLQVTQERENSANALAAKDSDRAGARPRPLAAPVAAAAPVGAPRRLVGQGLEDGADRRQAPQRRRAAESGGRRPRRPRRANRDGLHRPVRRLVGRLRRRGQAAALRRLRQEKDAAPTNGRAFHDGARLWDGGADSPAASKVLGAGPVAFHADGTPLQLVPDAKDRLRLILWDVGRRQQVREFRFSAKGDPGPLNNRNGPLMALTAERSRGRGVGRPGGRFDADRRLGGGLRQGRRGNSTPAPARSARWPSPRTAAAWPWATRTERSSSGRCRRGAPAALPSAGRTRINGLAFGRSPRRAGRPAPDLRNWLLADGDAGGTTAVWDLERNAPQTYCHGSDYDVYRVAFSPDGATLASAGRYYTRLWDVATGRLLITLYHADFMTGLAFSPDGRRLAVSTQTGYGSDGGAHVWALEPGRGMKTLRGLSSQVAKVCLSPDGTLLAALSHDWQAAVWDLRTGSLLHLLDAPRGTNADNAALAFSPDDRQFALAAGTEARLWDFATAEEKSWPLPPGLQDNMAFDPAGKKLLLVRAEAADGANVPWGQGRRRVCPLRDLLGPEPAKPIREIDYFNWRVGYIKMAPGGGWFAIDGLHGDGGGEEMFEVFDGATGTEVWPAAASKKSDMQGMGFDATGKLLAVVPAGGGRADLLELPSRRHVGFAGRTLPRTWVPRGGSRANPAQVKSGYELLRGDGDAPLATLGIDSLVSGVQSQFSADGNTLVWGNADGSVIVCNVPEVQSRLNGVGLGW